MRKIFLVLMVAAFAAFLVAGCGLMRQTMEDIGDAKIKNTEAGKRLSDQILEVWEFRSGFLSAFLDDYLDCKPCQNQTKVKAAYDRLNAISALKISGQEITDRLKGEVLSNSVLLVKEIGEDIIKDIAPDFLKLVRKIVL